MTNPKHSPIQVTMKTLNSILAKTSTLHHASNSCGSGKYQILVSGPPFQYSHFPPNGKHHKQTLITLLQSLAYGRSSPDEVPGLMFESAKVFSGHHLTVSTGGRAKPAPTRTKGFPEWDDKLPVLLARLFFVTAAHHKA